MASAHLIGAAGKVVTGEIVGKRCLVTGGKRLEKQRQRKKDRQTDKNTRKSDFQVSNAYDLVKLKVFCPSYNQSFPEHKAFSWDDLGFKKGETRTVYV